MKAKDYIYIGIISMLVFYFFTNKNSEPVKDVIVNEVTERLVFTEKIKDSGVFISKPIVEYTLEKVNIDSLKKELSAQFSRQMYDTVAMLDFLYKKKLELLAAKKIRKYKDSAETDIYKLKLFQTTQGYLLKSGFELTLKPQKNTVYDTKQIVKKYPISAFWIGGKIGVNHKYFEKSSLFIEAAFQDRTGNLWELGFKPKLREVEVNQLLLGYKKQLWVKYRK
ncbi:hypothetical protein [Flavicella sp.]|uniref:hypothetical protein n=1 Tax=Flavicella sp. TaxID=2957742 RepID=UPI003016D488